MKNNLEGKNIKKKNQLNQKKKKIFRDIFSSSIKVLNYNNKNGMMRKREQKAEK
jgi:hypothetical protein